MRLLAIILSWVSGAALILAVDAVTTRVFSDPRGFEAQASIAVLFWGGFAIAAGSVLLASAFAVWKKEKPWKSSQLVCSLSIVAAYGIFFAAMSGK